MKKPEANEWWQYNGVRVYLIGQKRNGHVVCEYRDGSIATLVVGDWWTHLPDCTGWDWQPEVAKSATRTIILRQWIAWNEIGFECEVWRVTKPIAWDNCYETGETKTVEVPQ